MFKLQQKAATTQSREMKPILHSSALGVGGEIFVLLEKGETKKWEPGADGKRRRESGGKEKGAEEVERRLWGRRKKKEIKII